MRAYSTVSMSSRSHGLGAYFRLGAAKDAEPSPQSRQSVMMQGPQGSALTAFLKDRAYFTRHGKIRTVNEAVLLGFAIPCWFIATFPFLGAVCWIFLQGAASALFLELYCRGTKSMSRVHPGGPRAGGMRIRGGNAKLPLRNSVTLRGEGSGSSTDDNILENM